MKDIKYLLIVISLFGLIYLFISNEEKTNNKRRKLKTQQFEQYKQFKKTQDSIYQDSIQKHENVVNSMKDSIQFIKYYTTNPNSVGGVDCNIVWKNNTKRTIKYMRFGVVAVNGVDDPVTCRIRDNYITYLKVTGPIKSKTTDGWNTHWENTWYNHSIRKMKIHSYEIEFMDGNKVEVML
jgi:hypothetical protein